jgi:hypothetical protein
MLSSRAMRLAPFANDETRRYIVGKLIQDFDVERVGLVERMNFPQWQQPR